MQTFQQPYNKEYHEHKRIFVALKDWQWARHFSKHLIEKNLFRKPWQRGEKIFLEQVAYSTSLVISYCRPFTVTKEPNIPSGKHGPIGIKKAQFTNQEKVVHENFLKYRNEIFAHSAGTHYTVKPMGGFIIESGGWFELVRDEVEILDYMIAKLTDSYTPEQKKLHDFLSQQGLELVDD